MLNNIHVIIFTWCISGNNFISALTVVIISPWPSPSCSDMFAVIGRGMYAHADPSRFGSMWLALFTLFQLLTLDDWFFIYEDVVKADPSMSSKSPSQRISLNLSYWYIHVIFSCRTHHHLPDIIHSDRVSNIPKVSVLLQLADSLPRTWLFLEGSVF